jgi:signal transduction histidine kinase
MDSLKRELLAQLPHELRTLLTSIIGYAEFVRDGGAGLLKADQQSCVEALLVESTRLESLVVDLLERAEAAAQALETRNPFRDIRVSRPGSPASQTQARAA